MASSRRQCRRGWGDVFGTRRVSEQRAAGAQAARERPDRLQCQTDAVVSIWDGSVLWLYLCLLCALSLSFWEPWFKYVVLCICFCLTYALSSKIFSFTMMYWIMIYWKLAHILSTSLFSFCCFGELYNRYSSYFTPGLESQIGAQW